jgi:ribosomal protein S18 acetylase RimI-like enzyme
MTVSYSWRGEFKNEALNALHADAFERPNATYDWWTQINRYSLGWVCARNGETLVGFVNVASDGGVRAFILDTIVARQAQRQGIGAEMVLIAIRESRKAGCEWLRRL